jgi:hypothetical protein
LIPNKKRNTTGNVGTSQYFWCVRANTVSRKQWQLRKTKKRNHCRKCNHSNHMDSFKLGNHENHGNKCNHRNHRNILNLVRRLAILR